MYLELFFDQFSIYTSGLVRSLETKFAWSTSQVLFRGVCLDWRSKSVFGTCVTKVAYLDFLLGLFWQKEAKNEQSRVAIHLIPGFKVLSVDNPTGWSPNFDDPLKLQFNNEEGSRINYFPRNSLYIYIIFYALILILNSAIQTGKLVWK